MAKSVSNKKSSKNNKSQFGAKVFIECDITLFQSKFLVQLQWLTPICSRGIWLFWDMKCNNEQRKFYMESVCREEVKKTIPKLAISRKLFLLWNRNRVYNSSIQYIRTFKRQISLSRKTIQLGIPFVFVLPLWWREKIHSRQNHVQKSRNYSNVCVC